MKELSARNQLKGTIKKVTKGAVNSEVKIELSEGTEITSIITNASAERLGLKEGVEAYAVIKATSVMIGKD
jgi:molybdopterin-binding protein